MTFEESLHRAMTTSAPVRIYFANAHCINLSYQIKEYRAALENAELVLNDGAGMEIAGRYLKRPFPENLNGTDWIPAFLKHQRNKRLFILGSTPEILGKATARIQSQNSTLSVVGSFHGFFDEPSEALAAIQSVHPEILLVAMGVPKQELFIDTHWEELKKFGVQKAIAGGAILSFIAGAEPRAPSFVQKLRLEWLYRLIYDPKRLFSRYIIGNLTFIKNLLFRA